MVFRGIGATRLCCGWLDYLMVPLMADWPSAPGICAIMPGFLLVRLTGALPLSARACSPCFAREV
jgi:hypothetical protein